MSILYVRSSFPLEGYHGIIITPEKIEYMKNYLKEHPIDPQYDEPEGYIVLDGNTPPSQLAARGYYDILKKLGELPE